MRREPEASAYGAELSWYAVHVRSRHEFRVAERLALTGIEAFLPVVERLSSWKDRKKVVKFPLFPGYLFVRMGNENEEKRVVLKTAGVVRFVCFRSGEPESVPDEQIESLRRLVENKAELDPYPYLKEGQRVRIRRGALKGIEGILVQRLGEHMLVLSVDILQQGTALKIETSEVENV
jgi:transcription elongation factor/antiterminator RfaH